MSVESTLQFRNLSQHNINRVEDAIKSSKLQPIEKNFNLSISYQYYDLASTSYKEMLKQETHVTNYCQFAANGMGYQSYGFYKSIDGNIYIVDTFLEEINNIYIPDKNIDCLKHFFIDF